MLARGCSIAIEAMRSGPMSRPLAPSTRIVTGPTLSASATARRSPASVVTSQAAPAASTASAAAIPASSHRTQRRAGQAISELRREIDVQPRAAVGLGDRLRDVEADAQEWQAVAKSDPDRVLERVAEGVERVAPVHEDRRDEVLREAALQLDGSGQQVASAHLVAVRIDGRELLVAVAAHALVAAGEEAVRGGQLLELADRARAELAAHVDPPLVVEPEEVVVRDVDAREVRVGAELLRRSEELDAEARRHGIRPQEIGWQPREGHPRHDELALALVDERRGTRLRRHLVRRNVERRRQHALPATAHLGEADREGAAARLVVRALLAEALQLERELLERVILPGNHVREADRVLDVGSVHLGAQALAAVVEAAV